MPGMRSWVNARATIVAALAVGCGLQAVATAEARAEVGINVYGLSHHLKNPLNEELREFNPGLGLQWTFSRAGRGSLEGNVGIYQDSYGHANHHLSLGGRVRVAGPIELGLQMINASSSSFNGGEPILTPYPFVAARLPGATLNLAYIPEVQSINAMPSLATFVTIYPWRRAADSPNEPAPAGAGSVLEFGIAGLARINGFSGNGMLWRHMFDERRGMRLGVMLDGTVSTWHNRDQESGPDGYYDAALLLQYLSRGEPRGRWRPYWATGLETQFYAGYGADRLTEAWRSDLGVEYRIGDGLALALEYGVKLTYSWRDVLAFEDYSETAERRLNLRGTGTRLALLVSRGAADGGAPMDPQQPVSGPVVLLGSDLDTQPFDNAAVAWHWRPSPTRGWRLALRPDISTEQHDLDRDRRFGLEIRGERLFRRPQAGGVATYWGLGPILRFSYSDARYSYDDGSTASYANRSTAVGLTSLVGAEIAITEGLYALAEYSADLRWTRSDDNNDYLSNRWEIGVNEVRLGLASAF